MSLPGRQLRPIEARSVVEQVAAELRRSILSGRLEPGQEFGQREIAALLNVSFIPVREALRSLEGEGLIRTRPGRSAIVTPVNLADLSGIYRVRLRLEPEIVSRACGLLREPELDRLEAQALRFGRLDRGVDEIHAAHWTFHAAVVAPVATEWDFRILTTLWQAAERYVRIGVDRGDPEPTDLAAHDHSHSRLVDVLRSRDPDAARAATREHLDHEHGLAMCALDLHDTA